MLRFLTCLTFGCLAALSPVHGVEDLPFFLGGIQVNEPDHDRWIGALDRVGMNTVAVTVYAHQGDWDSENLWWADEEPSVLDEIRRAKAAGLHVVLILRVAVDHAFEANRFIWHGMIFPEDDTTLTAWFERYRRFARKWATVAEEEGVDVFGIGSEMNQLNETRPLTRYGMTKGYLAKVLYEKRFRKRTRRFADDLEGRELWVRGYPGYDDVETYLDERFRAMKRWAKQVHLKGEPRRLKRLQARRERVLEEWHRLIEEVRTVYRGRLTYAANFDSYDQVAFWDRLDLMGINAYFKLRGGVASGQIEPTDRDRFERKWRKIFNRIDQFQREAGTSGQPVLFTEVGYTFRQHSTVEPWAHGGFSVVGWGTKRRNLVIWSEQPIDYDERALALEALARVQRSESLPLTGLLYWKLSTNKDHERIEPFVLHVGPQSEDPLQQRLLEFLTIGAATP